jgi:hypothetical protein
MAVHAELSPAEAADRLALRELFDAYAHRADRRDAAGQKALFTDDTVFAIYMDGEGSEPTDVGHARTDDARIGVLLTPRAFPPRPRPPLSLAPPEGLYP